MVAGVFDETERLHGGEGVGSCLDRFGIPHWRRWGFSGKIVG